MKEWLHRQLSSDQTLGDQIIGYLIVGTVFFLAIGIGWFLLFIIAASLLTFCKWIYKKTGRSSYNIERKFYDIDDFISETYNKFNVFKINSNLNERFSHKGKLKFKLVKGIFWGVLAMIAAFVFVYSISGNPYYEYQLLKNGTTTKGFITDVSEDVEPRDAGGYTYYYNYAYNFKIADGKTIHSYQGFSGGSQQKTPDVSEPYPTEIVYLKSNPEINKLKDSLSDSVWEILWRKIGLGTLLLIAFSSFGFILIRNALKDYLTESKKPTPINE